MPLLALVAFAFAPFFGLLAIYEAERRTMLAPLFAFGSAFLFGAALFLVTL